MTDVHVPGGLDEFLAATIGRELAERGGRIAADGAAARAPNAKVWATQEDDRVRPAHRHAHGQTVPDNVPFRLEKMNSRGEVVAGGDYDLADAPRDPHLPKAQRAECRCFAGVLPGAVAEAVSADPVELVDATASVEVVCRFPGARESEHAEQGGGWMAGGLADAADYFRAR